MEAFRPFPGLANAHVQTVLGASPRLGPAPLVPVERVLFDTEPGTRVLALCQWQPRPAPALVVLHGLGGGPLSGYAAGTAHKAVAAGLHAVRMATRNCAGTEHLTPTLYHAGLTADARAVVETLARDPRVTRVHLAGFSLGGNQALRLAAELCDAGPGLLAGVTAVCPPIDLARCQVAIDERRANALYRRKLLGSLVGVLRKKAASDPRWDTDGLARVRTLREFDDRWTGPSFGFRDAADYYARASAGPVLDAIRVPALVLTSQDDPIVPFESFVRIGAGPVELVAPPRGGHCAFVAAAAERDGRGRADRRWAEHRVVERACSAMP